MVCIADQNPIAGLMWCSPPFWRSSFQAIGSNNRPPASISPGSLSSHTTAAVITMRTAMAPSVPQKMACFCRCLGRLRAASAMTMALSPASTRSIRMMLSSPDQKVEAKTSMLTPTRGTDSADAGAWPLGVPMVSLANRHAACHGDRGMRP